MKHLILTNAASDNLDTICNIYWGLLDSSEEYASILRWKKDIYPADEDWLSYIAKGEMYFIWDEGNLIGAAALAKSQPADYRKVRWGVDARDDEVAVVHLLAIRPQYQGQGYATAALQELVRLAEKLGKKALRLDAIGTNKPAQKLYEKFGFANCGTEQLYYESTGLTKFVFYELRLA